MERPTSARETDVVRCLDCGTVYSQPGHQDEARGCPTCGYVGWIVTKPPPRSDDRDS
jgi:predicted  nucleic acid-binding Zn-ribbon protein